MPTSLRSYFSNPTLRSRSGADGGTWVAEPRYNDFSKWQSSPDAAVLRNTGLRSRLAHDALMRGQASEAQDDNDLLSTATPDELSNLFGQPRTEREARLQQIVQKDYNARERGVALIPNERQKLDYAQKLENLKSSRLENYLNPLKFDLQKQAASLREDEFKDAVINRDNANVWEQRKMENAENWHADDKTELQRRFDLEYALKHEAQNRADQRSANSDFFQIQKAVRDGELSAEDVINAVPTLTPGQQSVLRGHEAAAIQAAQNAAALAQRYNTRLNTPPPTIPATPHRLNLNPFSGFGIFSGSDAIPPQESEIAAARDAVIRDYERNALARKQLMLDPDSGQFVPLLRAPSRSGAPVASALSTPYSSMSPAEPYTRVSPLNNPIYDAGTSGGAKMERQDGSVYQDRGDWRQRAPMTQPQSRSIPVPEDIQSRYQNGRVYVINGVPHRYVDGVMLR